MRNTLPFLAVLSIAAIAANARADVWNESGDAGPSIPGQMTVGGGLLTQIRGTLAGNNAQIPDFEDVYCIFIDAPQEFTATAVGGANFDTQLFLFDDLGRGVSHNDDSQSTLQSTITGMFVAAPGTYMLAITGYNRDPISDSGLIWNNSPFGAERIADGPGAGQSLLGWTGTGGEGAYSIALLGLGGLVTIKRRRR